VVLLLEFQPPTPQFPCAVRLLSSSSNPGYSAASIASKEMRCLISQRSGDVIHFAKRMGYG
jgi:hypothetical protein